MNKHCPYSYRFLIFFWVCRFKRHSVCKYVAIKKITATGNTDIINVGNKPALRLIVCLVSEIDSTIKIASRAR